MKKSEAQKELAQLNELAEVLRKIIATLEITPTPCNCEWCVSNQNGRAFQK